MQDVVKRQQQLHFYYNMQVFQVVGIQTGKAILQNVTVRSLNMGTRSFLGICLALHHLL